MTFFSLLGTNNSVQEVNLCLEKKRAWQQEMCHHIMFRGVDGRALFFDDQDRIRFCLFLQEAAELHSLKVHAFCLMTNHIHLILEPVKGAFNTRAS